MPDPVAPKKWTYLFVVAFSAIIVSLGAKDLHHRFVQRGANVDIKKLVRDLKGDPDEMRASLARKSEKTESKTNHEPVTDFEKQELKKIIDKIAP